MSTVAVEVETRTQVSLSDLLGGLRALRKVVPTRTTLPVLSNIRMRTVEGGIELSGTDLDLWHTQVVPAELGEGFDLTAPLKMLHDLLEAGSEEGTAVLYATGDQLRVEIGECVISLRGTVPEEFPTEPHPTASTELATLSGVEINATLVRAHFGTSTQESRPILNGVFWSFADGKITAVATNGHRLIEVVRDQSHGAVGSFIVPAKVAALLGDEIGDDEYVHVLHRDNFIAFETPRVRIVARLIEGRYPDYAAVFPSIDALGVLEIGRDAFLGLIDRAILLDSSNHRIKLHVSAGEMEVTARTYDGATVRDFAECEWSGDKFALPLNGHYLKSVLNNIESNTVTMRFFGMEKAMTMQGSGDNARYLIMPLRDFE